MWSGLAYTKPGTVRRFYHVRDATGTNYPDSVSVLGSLGVYIAHVSSLTKLEGTAHSEDKERRKERRNPAVVVHILVRRMIISSWLNAEEAGIVEKSSKRASIMRVKREVFIRQTGSPIQAGSTWVQEVERSSYHRQAPEWNPQLLGLLVLGVESVRPAPSLVTPAEIRTH
ncbi:hypothetical protein RRG08_020003 [Elysia crispata]|uniref:Uncharacterized protein n=1 Tax=Elysia crispata TaxID=231223 RepID=A0AAE1BCT6_9GAST|nr:hypothetical protein RRG08_020003 [Elysia crispata]